MTDTSPQGLQETEVPETNTQRNQYENVRVLSSCKTCSYKADTQVITSERIPYGNDMFQQAAHSTFLLTGILLTSLSL
ncbi:unnamed protein product [Dicrocoelium dendriticum]|nr:unnamed protein product [Dicrocoelium dendriticum]